MAQLDINTPLKDVLVAIDKKAARANADRDTLESILVGKGVNVVPGSKLSVLIEKVRGEVNTRKKIATGSMLRVALDSVSGLFSGVSRMAYCHRIPVNNLGFVPSKIFVYRREDNRDYEVKNALSAYYDKAMDEDNCYAFAIYSYAPFGGINKIPVKENKVITATGFNMIAGVNDSDSTTIMNYFWIAIE